MRSFFLGLLLLGLSGALLGAALTWPDRASEVARNSPTLSEFQTGVQTGARVQRLSGTPTRQSPAPAARTERKALGEARAAEQLAHVMDEARYELDRTSDASGQAALLAVSQAPPQLLSAGENLPEMVLPQPAGSHTPDLPRRQEAPTESVVGGGTASPPAATEVAASAPVMDPPRLPAQSAASASRRSADRDRSCARNGAAADPNSRRSCDRCPPTDAHDRSPRGAHFDPLSQGHPISDGRAADFEPTQISRSEQGRNAYNRARDHLACGTLLFPAGCSCRCLTGKHAGKQDGELGRRRLHRLPAQA